MAYSYTTHRGKRVSRAHAVMLAAYERKTGRALYINQGARTIAEQTAFWNHYQRYGWPLAAYPSPGAPHIKYGRENHALDINADVVRGLAAFYRANGVPVAFNVPGEPWHMDTPSETALIAAAKRLGGTAFLPTIRKGSHGPSVAKLQVYLRMAKDSRGKGYLPAGWHAHESYTLFVRKAVRRFQREHNLTADGIVGPKTWGVLYRAAHN